MLGLLYGRVLHSILHAYLIAKQFFTTLQREVKYLLAHSAVPLHNGRLSNLSGDSGGQGLCLDSPSLHSSFLAAWLPA